MKLLKSLFVVAVVTVVGATSAEAGGLFRRHHTQSVIYTQAQTVVSTSRPNGGTRTGGKSQLNSVSCDACSATGSCQFHDIDCCPPDRINQNGWDITGKLKVLSIADFDVATSTAAFTQVPCDSFAIELCASDRLVGTLAGDPVRFVAMCQVQLPPDHYLCLKKTGCPWILCQPIKIIFNGTLDADGHARFKRADLFTGITAELQRLRFFEHPSLFGLSELRVKVTGVARSSCYIFESCNSFTLYGSVDRLRAAAANLPAPK